MKHGRTSNERTARPSVGTENHHIASPQLVLAIETTAPRPGAALASASGEEVSVLAMEALPETNGARAEGLGACVRAVLARAGVDARELTGIGVVDGPGSYTGLRVGLALARGLALVDGLRVSAVGSLELIARAAAHTGSRDDRTRICALLDASHDKLYAAGFARDGGELVETWPASLLTTPELYERLRADGERWLTCGDAVMANLVPLDVTVAPARAEMLARMAIARLARGLGVVAGAVLPRYVGPSGARPHAHAAVRTVAEA